MQSDELMHLVPASLQGKEEILFGNLHELFTFHNDVFLKDLENCISTTELVALCFVQRVNIYKTKFVIRLYLRLFPIVSSVTPSIGCTRFIAKTYPDLSDCGRHSSTHTSSYKNAKRSWVTNCPWLRTY